VKDSNGNKVNTADMLNLIEGFNKNISTDVAVNGQNKIYIVPANMTRDFINYTIDFSVTLTNCYPDKEQARVSVKMVD